ncbi:hypothetical protein VCRA2113O118_30343 [Vibrio crassostreae]|nr:hypothetical protein VCRA2113O119_20016 [Vibrio crassostreae]CAK2005214.1 hypothetical protein VCRA2113O120_310032 [Vibrio crassostreae]CAK2071436.1 hypothetical protein VCRA2114E122_40016 [Vibrio crassostreae]CAK2135611.1 hypothetical protein VCRA2110O113_50321 [Vibrio crassostreae]CAK2326577.1 hypothetical protein VCRA2112O114_310015 [Vibrio crassostreae]
MFDDFIRDVFPQKYRNDSMVYEVCIPVQLRHSSYSVLVVHLKRA